MRLVACLSGVLPIFVSELIDETSTSWDKNKFSATFMPTDTKTICNIPLSTIYLEDFWARGHDKNGVFSVRAAYKMFVTT